MAKNMSGILRKACSNGKAAKGIEEPSAVKLLSGRDVEGEEESTDTDEEGTDSGDESKSGEEEGEDKGDTGEEEGEVGEDEEDGEDSDEEEADEREESQGFRILGPEKPPKNVPAVSNPGIQPSSASALNPVRSFDEMGLDPRLLRGLVKRRLLKPTPVQQYCVPLAMEGRDVVAMAHTGSGKTLAYLLPLLHRVLADKDSAPAAAGAGGTCPRAVVLVPTRELCQQVRGGGHREKEGERLLGKGCAWLGEGGVEVGREIVGREGGGRERVVEIWAGEDACVWLSMLPPFDPLHCSRMIPVNRPWHWQVAEEVAAMGQYCGGALTVQRLTTGMNNAAMRAAMEKPNVIVVATPARMAWQRVWRRACPLRESSPMSIPPFLHALSPLLSPLTTASGHGEATRRGGGNASAHGGVCGGGCAVALGAQDTPRCHGAGRGHSAPRACQLLLPVPPLMQPSLPSHVCQQADVLLSHGYYSEVQAIARHVPVSCQCLLLTATFSDDIERLQKLVLHNPVVVRLGDSSGLLEDAQGGAGSVGGVGLGVEGQAVAEAAAAGAGEAAEAGAGGQSNQNQSLLPPNIRQFAVRCEEKDKLLHLLALIRLQLLQKKVLIFTSTVEAGFRVKLFLEQFGIRAAVLNSELPVASRLHILHDFNAGKFFFLIATDDDNGGLSAKNGGKGGKGGKGGNNNGRGDSGRDSKRCRVRIAEGGEGGREEGEEEVERDTGEYGVVRGIDFKNVRTVINYSVPNQLAPYVHRVGRTGRASSVGMAITLVSPKEAPLLEALDRKIAQSMARAGGEKGGEDGKKGGTHGGVEHGVKGESGSGSSRKRAREAEDEEGEESEEEGEVEDDEEEGEEEGTDEEEEDGEEEQEESEEEEESDDSEKEEDDDEEEPAKPKPYECRAIVPYPYLPREGVEALRYRGEDVAGKITRVAIREARAKELRWEILNSEKLKDHFDLNPKDRDLLKHDKVLAKVAPSPHLKSKTVGMGGKEGEEGEGEGGSTEATGGGLGDGDGEEGEEEGGEEAGAGQTIR
ncbi:unnamed protein product [Closterium sp. NIES-64]|nr:unnamed protein product [Closterium sp. NIES-64]CAI5950788.1 unnamed protein product [Closterium sp. NIES-64]